MPVSNEELRNRLLQERAYLLEQQLTRLGENEHRGAGYGNHIADDATETFEQAKEVSIQQNETSLLWLINHALEKFELGTYGICEACGAPIDRARLKALPYALYCLDCQAQIEQRR